MHADILCCDQLPRLHTLRRIPTRYRRTLPLQVIKQYQCLVIGAARGVLTVAMTDVQDRSVIEVLSTLTGQRIFPVLVEPARMRLLIRRVERYERRRRSFAHLSCLKGCLYAHVCCSCPFLQP